MIWTIWPFSGGGGLLVQAMILGGCCWPFDALGASPGWVLVLGVIVRLTLVVWLFSMIDALLDPANWND